MSYVPHAQERPAAKPDPKQLLQQSFTRHKQNVQRAIAELEDSLEEATDKQRIPLTESPGKRQKKESFILHKEKVKKAIESLYILENSMDRSASSVNVTKSNYTTAGSTTYNKDDSENTLAKKQYAEEQVDYTLEAKEKIQQDEEKAYRWVEKSTDLVYYISSSLTLIASLLTALATYIFVYLPKSVYSHHALHEIFLINDDVISLNKFNKTQGLQLISPLPLVILVMFLMVLYLAYLIQYPKQSKLAMILRTIVFVVFEVYLALCIVSYSVDAGEVDTRLNKFFEKDKVGLIIHKGKDPQPPFSYLTHSQEYFGCCGFKRKSEWQTVFPEQYGESWPLSCCDAKGSGCACYGPVKEEVKCKLFPKDNDDVIPEPKSTKRLYKDNCFKMEKIVAKTVTSLAIVLIFIYLALSTWALIVISRISLLVTSKNMEIKMKPQYVDFF